MHRSGTSFLARALNLSGAYLGELDSITSHEWESPEDNPKGHWENKKILELSEKTLENSNGSWHEVPKKIVLSKTIEEGIKKSIKELQQKSGLAAAFKDPRLILCFEEWKKFLPENFVIIGIIRDPLKVAESIKIRNQFSYEKSLNLWKIYNQKLLDILDEHGGFLLDFDWPKAKLFEEMKLICKKLGLAQTTDLSDWYSEDLLKSDKSYQSSYKLDENLKILYSKLKDRTKNNENVKVKIGAGQPEQKSQIIDTLLYDIQKQGAFYTNVLNQSHKELRRLQKEFAERTEWAISLDEKLKKKNKEIAYLQIAIQTKDAQIQNLYNELEQAEFELNEIKNSVMYGITSVIARNLDKLAPESTRRRNALRLASAAYLMRKERGSKVLLGEAKRKIIKTRLKTKPSSRPIPHEYLKTLQGTKFSSNVLKIENDFEPDFSLRKFMKFGSNNVTKLPRYPKISIVISTFDQTDVLKNNLASIKSKTTYQNYEIIIVTNNLDENSEMREFLKTIDAQVLIYQDEYSFGGMNNFAAAKAQGEFLLFLNDDVEVQSPNWLEAFLVLALNESTGAVGPKLLSSSGKLQDCGGIVWRDGNAWNHGRNHNPSEPKFNYVRDVDYCSGSCLLVKKTVFDKIGGFDSRFSPAYWEDTDLCFEIRKLGYQVLYQPLASLVHYEGLTRGINPNKGLKSYQKVNQKKFLEKWKSVLDTHLYSSNENSFSERDRKEGLNILYIDHYVPEPDRDSGSLRTFGILGILAHMKNKVTFWPDNQKYNTPYVTELQQKGIEVIYKTGNFEKFLEERKNLYDLVILARPYISVKYVDSIKKKMTNCKVIYDTIDLHHLRMYRQASLENKDVPFQAKIMRELEFSMIKKSDITILTSPVEAEFLHREDKSLKFAILPNIHIKCENIEKFEGRKNMMFLGAFQHEPNIDAAQYLVKDIWPHIKKSLPEVKLYIMGSNPQNKIKKLASDDIVVTGFVRNLEPYYRQFKLMLAPLRFGAGVKGKITQSLATGLPVITTSVGAEGINVNSENCMIADSPEDFVKKAVRVYSDEKLWSLLSKNGLKVANEFSPEKARACLGSIISSII